MGPCPCDGEDFHDTAIGPCPNDGEDSSGVLALPPARSEIFGKMQIRVEQGCSCTLITKYFCLVPKHCIGKINIWDLAIIY